MDILNSKISYLKDLAVEHHSSLQSLETVAEAAQNLLDILEKEISLRNREKTGFVTKVGVALREGLLQHYNSMVNQIQTYYCSAFELHDHLSQQHRSLLEVIYDVDSVLSQTHPVVQEIQRITTQQGDISSSLKAVTAREENARESRSGRKRAGSRAGHHRHTQSLKENQKNAPNTPYRLNLLKIDRSGKETMLEMSQRIGQTQIFEVNCVLEECIKSVGDLAFLRDYASQQELLPSYANLTSFTPSPPSPAFGRHGASLGLQSKGEEEEINLFCDENIDHLATPKASIEDSLQRITEEEEEHFESDTPKGFRHRNLSVR